LTTGTEVFAHVGLGGAAVALVDLERDRLVADSM
jgi:hypothetical protein